MTNKKELQVEMVRYGDTGLSLAEALDITNPSFSSKLNNHNQFTQREISIIKERYSLSNDRLEEIFFNREVPN